MQAIGSVLTCHNTATGIHSRGGRALRNGSGVEVIGEYLLAAREAVAATHSRDYCMSRRRVRLCSRVEQRGNDPDGPFSPSGKVRQNAVQGETSSQGPVMKQSNSDKPAAARTLNAVALQSAVLCAECDVVTDSPHDTCMVCGSRSLVNICRILGGKMPKKRVQLVRPEPLETTREVVLHFSRPHRVRRRLSV